MREKGGEQVNKRSGTLSLNFDELDNIFSNKELKDKDLMSEYIRDSFVEYILNEIRQGTLRQRIIVE